jgi:hypothetical protein
VKALNVFVAVVVSSLSLPLMSQNQRSPSWAACGDLQIAFSVGLAKSQHIVLPPEPGKARIVFIQDSPGITRVGIGGRWVGALKGNSYFSVSVEPGEQHLCAAAKDNHLVLAHMVAEAGKTYYFRIRLLSEYPASIIFLNLNPVDGDEAAFQIGFFPMATAHSPKRIPPVDIP